MHAGNDVRAIVFVDVYARIVHTCTCIHIYVYNCMYIIADMHFCGYIHNRDVLSHPRRTAKLSFGVARSTFGFKMAKVPYKSIAFFVVSGEVVGIQFSRFCWPTRPDTEAKAPKRKPPKHGFYSCCASKKHPNGGRQIADTIRDLHPTRVRKQKRKKVFSPRKGALGREPHGSRTGAARDPLDPGGVVRGITLKK